MMLSTSMQSDEVDRREFVEPSMMEIRAWHGTITRHSGKGRNTQKRENAEKERER